MRFKILFTGALTNLFLMALFFISLQNTYHKNYVKFLSFKSVEIPVGLILGLGFFSGSSLGTALKALSTTNKES